MVLDLRLQVLAPLLLLPSIRGGLGAGHQVHNDGHAAGQQLLARASDAEPPEAQRHGVQLGEGGRIGVAEGRPVGRQE
eukprot:2589177-Pyramimonas_sp.AAC.1